MSKTKWYQKPIYLLVALALVLSLAVVAVPVGTVRAATPIYVNGSTGNDSWDGESADWDGTHGPKKTIKAGIQAVDSPGTVHVAAGTYYENDIRLKDNVQVLGAGADVTTIDGGGGLTRW
jgi:hypothetical protein